MNNNAQLGDLEIRMEQTSLEPRIVQRYAWLSPNLKHALFEVEFDADNNETYDFPTRLAGGKPISEHVLLNTVWAENVVGSVDVGRTRYTVLTWNETHPPWKKDRDFELVTGNLRWLQVYRSVKNDGKWYVNVPANITTGDSVKYSAYLSTECADLFENPNRSDANRVLVYVVKPTVNIKPSAYVY